MNGFVTLHHGSGGSKMHDLIRKIFVKHFSNQALNDLRDSAILQNPRSGLAFTTDSYVVDPVFFPGGDIGKLAVCGTLNDLAVSFAKPVALSASFILEEGLPLADLERIVRSMARETKKAGIPIVTGDTKVVPRGKCDKLFINTSGIGLVRNPAKGSGPSRPIRAGDCIVLSGPLGEHAIAILLARESFQFRARVKSDCASLYPMIASITAISGRIRVMRDVTRGGLSTVLNEIIGTERTGILLSESKIPVSREVNAVCELLGFDPLNLANEGRFIAVVGKEDAGTVVERVKGFPDGKHAAVIGEVVAEHPGKVMMRTVSGGYRRVEMVSGEQLPRIC